MSSPNDLQVIFGTGPVGLAIMDELLLRGKRIRMVNRSGKTNAAIPLDVEVVAGDATDPDSTRKAAQGASVVYNALNAPNYEQWASQFPPLQKGVLEGAAYGGAKLVVIENVYMYGSTGGKPITEDLPYLAKGARGRTRATLAQELHSAHTSGKVQVVSGRASDFFGPRVIQSAAGAQAFKAALAGGKAQVMVSADHLHTFTYMPDIGKALVMLSENEAAFGQAWHLPSCQTLTTRQFLKLVYEEAGKELNIQVAPKLLMKAMGLFVPSVRGISELFYEFEEDFVVDHRKFEGTFGNHATPLREAIRTTLAWCRQN
jgi:nucleoside-diphosphate-sugar epimerase